MKGSDAQSGRLAKFPPHHDRAGHGDDQVDSRNRPHGLTQLHLKGDGSRVLFPKPGYPAQPLHAVNDAETHRIADVRLQHLDDMLSPVARKGDDSTSQFILFRQYDIHFPYAGWRLYDNFNIFQLYIPHNRSPPQPLRLWISCIPCTVWLPAPVDSHLPAASSPICSRRICITFSEEGSMLLLYTQEEGTHC